MKGFEYYKCLAVQGTSMILTFTIFGVYLDSYLSKIYENPRIGNLIFSLVAIALSLIVVYGILDPNTATQMPVLKGFHGNYRAVLALFAQIAITQVFFSPKLAVGRDDHGLWNVFWSFYFALFWIISTFIQNSLLKEIDH